MASIDIPHFKLNSGTTIPGLGLGTWLSDNEGRDVKEAVLHAIKCGYRHIDGAWFYQNEKAVGAALKEAFDSGIVTRSDLFITTKVWGTFHSRPLEAVNLTLADLGVDYLDLVLMHWPIPLNENGSSDKVPLRPDGSRDLADKWDYKQSWDLLSKLPKDKVRAVGVANCSVKYLEDLLDDPARPNVPIPAIDQIENHPQLPGNDLLEYCKKKGIVVTAYSQFGSQGAPVLKEPVLVELAEKYSVEPGTIVLSWQIARGVVVIPKSLNPSRIEKNLKLITLEAEDIKKIDAISKSGETRYIKPNWGVNLGWPDMQ